MEWKLTISWSIVVAIATTLVLASQLLAAIPVLAPWVPAHRGYVDNQVTPLDQRLDGLVDVIQKGVDRQVAGAREDINGRIDNMYDGLLDLQAVVLVKQLRDLRAEVVDLDLELEIRPRDPRLLNRRAEVRAQINNTEDMLRQTRCTQNPGSGWCLPP